MSPPQGFSWIEKPLLGALARPSSPDDLAWLRAQGVEVLLSLTEDRPRRDWSDGAGLGRTGVVLAAYFVAKGATAQNAIARVRRLRPGSVETDEQAEAIEHYARRRRREAEGA